MRSPPPARSPTVMQSQLQAVMWRQQLARGSRRSSVCRLGLLWTVRGTHEPGVLSACWEENETAPLGPDMMHEHIDTSACWLATPGDLGESDCVEASGVQHPVVRMAKSRARLNSTKWAETLVMGHGGLPQHIDKVSHLQTCCADSYSAACVHVRGTQHGLLCESSKS